MTKADDPAFTSGAISTPGESRMFWGLTKREIFAALTMQGFLTQTKDSTMPRGHTVQFMSVEMADALIAELNKSEPK